LKKFRLNIKVLPQGNEEKRNNNMATIREETFEEKAA